MVDEWPWSIFYNPHKNFQQIEADPEKKRKVMRRQDWGFPEQWGDNNSSYLNIQQTQINSETILNETYRLALDKANNGGLCCGHK